MASNSIESKEILQRVWQVNLTGVESDSNWNSVVDVVGSVCCVKHNQMKHQENISKRGGEKYKDNEIERHGTE